MGKRILKSFGKIKVKNGGGIKHYNRIKVHRAILGMGEEGGKVTFFGVFLFLRKKKVD